MREETKNGFISLLSVLVVGTVAMTIATSLVVLGIDVAKNNLTLYLSKQARGIADACAEEALRQIVNSNSFSGIVSLNINDGSCSYQVQNLGGQDRLITVASNAGIVNKKIRISLDQLQPQINVVSWQEIADF
jgi:hypothetical protein